MYLSLHKMLTLSLVYAKTQHNTAPLAKSLLLLIMMYKILLFLKSAYAFRTMFQNEKTVVLSTIAVFSWYVITSLLSAQSIYSSKKVLSAATKKKVSVKNSQSESIKLTRSATTSAGKIPVSASSIPSSVPSFLRNTSQTPTPTVIQNKTGESKNIQSSPTTTQTPSYPTQTKITPTTVPITTSPLPHTQDPSPTIAVTPTPAAVTQEDKNCLAGSSKNCIIPPPPVTIHL